MILWQSIDPMQLDFEPLSFPMIRFKKMRKIHSNYNGNDGLQGMDRRKARRLRKLWGNSAATIRLASSHNIAPVSDRKMCRPKLVIWICVIAIHAQRRRLNSVQQGVLWSSPKITRGPVTPSLLVSPTTTNHQKITGTTEETNGESVSSLATTGVYS